MASLALARSAQVQYAAYGASAGGTLVSRGERGHLIPP